MCPLTPSLVAFAQARKKVEERKQRLAQEEAERLEEEERKARRVEADKRKALRQERLTALKEHALAYGKKKKAPLVATTNSHHDHHNDDPSAGPVPVQEVQQAEGEMFSSQPCDEPSLSEFMASKWYKNIFDKELGILHDAHVKASAAAYNEPAMTAVRP